MAPEVKKKFRKQIEKTHYWLQIDFLIRADTLESAVKRCGLLFRKAYRRRLTLSDTLVYMGAHGATCKGGLAPKRPGTFHKQVSLSKGLPEVPPARTIESVEADMAAKAAKKSAKADIQGSQRSVTLDVITEVPKAEAKALGLKPTAKPQKVKKASLAGLFAR